MSTISYQGVPASFSHIAAYQYFGPQHEYVGTNQFVEIFNNLSSNKSEYGVVPVENTLAGSVYENYDHLFHFDVYAIGEITIKIEHQLLGMQQSTAADNFKQIKKVYSHIKALEQCEHFFETHPWIEKIIHSDTAGAAKMVAESQDPTIAAIASRQAGELYKLQTLQANIEDDPRNFTRFLIISNEKKEIDNADKCSLIITLPHTPGSLYAALAQLASHGVNLTKIESRPILGKPFEYVFYIDIEFPDIPKSKMTEVIMNDFKKHTNSIKILGFYKSVSNKNT